MEVSWHWPPKYEWWCLFIVWCLVSAYVMPSHGKLSRKLTAPLLALVIGIYPPMMLQMVNLKRLAPEKWHRFYVYYIMYGMTWMLFVLRIGVRHPASVPEDDWSVFLAKAGCAVVLCIFFEGATILFAEVYKLVKKKWDRRAMEFALILNHREIERLKGTTRP